MEGYTTSRGEAFLQTARFHFRVFFCGGGEVESISFPALRGVARRGCFRRRKQRAKRHVEGEDHKNEPSYYCVGLLASREDGTISRHRHIPRRIRASYKEEEVRTKVGVR